MNPVLQLFQALIGQEMGAGAPPFSRWLRGVMREVEEGALTMEFTVRPEMANPVGLLHGGMQCAMIDEVIGMTAATLGRSGFYYSLDLHVDYLEKVKVGEKVIARSRILRQGQQILHAQCDLVDATGKLISRGTSNLLNSSPPARPTS